MKRNLLERSRSRFDEGRIMRIVPALFLVLIAIVRMFVGDCDGRFNLTTLAFLGLACILFALPHIEQIGFGDWLIKLRKEMEDVREIAEQGRQSAAEAGRTAEEVARSAAPKPNVLPSDKEGLKFIEPALMNDFSALQTIDVQPGSTLNDPWKGVFGGSAIGNGRELSATVKRVSANSPIYTIHLEVEGTDAAEPITGLVRFFLHPSFANPNPQVRVENGKAQLDLLATGSFTVGVLADGGRTRLELDLSEIPGVDGYFKTH